MSKKQLSSSLANALAHVQGKKTAGRVSTYPPADVNVLAIRKKLHYSQAHFAALYGFSLSTLRNWEQGRRYPDGPARTLLKVIEKYPEAVEAALHD